MHHIYEKMLFEQKLKAQNFTSSTNMFALAMKKVSGHTETCWAIQNACYAPNQGVVMLLVDWIVSVMLPVAISIVLIWAIFAF